MSHKPDVIYGTTILCVRKGNEVVIGGDGQVTLGSAIMKGTAQKVRTLYKDSVITGFAGSTADAFTLFERLERKLEEYQGKLMRSCVEMAKDWRSDKYLRKLEAMMIVADKEHTFILTGSGDVLSPENDACSIGSGGNFAISAARALCDCSDLDAESIVRNSMRIAGDICIYTNHNLVIKKLSSEDK